jgi:hypothetical protein
VKHNTKEEIMIPLINKDEHARLLSLRDKLLEQDEPNIGDVFVPVGPDPEDPAPSPFRILYIGRALKDGAHDPALDDYDRAVSWSKGVIRDRLILGDPPSPFWSFIREIVRRTFYAVGRDPASIPLDKIVAWSNLAKISALRGNPYGSQLKTQSKLCVDLLKAEIGRAKPTAIIIAVGDYAQREILYPLLGEEGWIHDTEAKNQNAKLSYGPDSTPVVWLNRAAVVWTNHPQGKGMGGPGNLEISRAFCTKAITKALGEVVP